LPARLGIYKNDPGTAAVIPLRGIEMKNQSAKTSLVVDARVAGFLYLIIAICGIFSMMYVPSKILVPGNAAATAANILASESLFRIGIVSDAVVFLSEIALIAILYALLKPVNETLSLVAALFRLAMAVIQGVNLLFNLAMRARIWSSCLGVAFCPSSPCAWLPAFQVGIRSQDTRGFAGNQFIRLPDGESRHYPFSQSRNNGFDDILDLFLAWNNRRIVACVLASVQRREHPQGGWPFSCSFLIVPNIGFASNDKWRRE
jgi:hypothetical protein